MFTTANELRAELSQQCHGDARSARAKLEGHWNSRGDSLTALPQSELREIANLYTAHRMGHLAQPILSRREPVLSAEEKNERLHSLCELPVMQLLISRAKALAPATVPTDALPALEPTQIPDVVRYLRAALSAGAEVRVVTHDRFDDGKLLQAQGPIAVVFENGEWSVAFVSQQEPRFSFGFMVRNIVAIGEPVAGGNLAWDFGASREHVDKFHASLDQAEISPSIREYLKSISSWAPGPWSWTLPAISVNGDRVVLAHRHGEAYYYPEELAGETYVNANRPESDDPSGTDSEHDSGEKMVGKEYTQTQRSEQHESTSASGGEPVGAIRALITPALGRVSSFFASRWHSSVASS